MASNSIFDYLSNVAKSVKFAAVEVVEETMPKTKNLIHENREAVKELYKDFLDAKQSLPRLNMMQDNTIFKMANKMFNNIKTDIASGQFYHPEREDLMAQMSAMSGLMAGMGGMGDDFMSELNAIFSGDFGDEGAEGTDPQLQQERQMVTKGDALVASALFRSQSISTNCIGKAMMRMHEHGTQIQRSISNMQFAQGQKTMMINQAGWSTMTEGFNRLIDFNNQVMKVHAENSKKFYEDVISVLHENNAILKSMHAIQKKVYEPQFANNTSDTEDPTKGTDSINFSEIFKGGFNLSAYRKMVKQNVQKTPVAMMYNLISALPMMMQSFVDNPLHEMAKTVINGVVGGQLQYAMQRLDSAIENAFVGGLAKLYDYGKNNKDTVLGKIAQVFGFKQERKSLFQIDTSKYEKGAMSWNGIAQKALVEVIPTHLARIDAAITGTDQRHFDFKSGKWIDAKEISKRNRESLKEDTKMAMSGMLDEQNELIKNWIDNMVGDEAQKRKMEKQLKHAANAMAMTLMTKGTMNEEAVDALRNSLKQVNSYIGDKDYKIKNKHQFDQLISTLIEPLDRHIRATTTTNMQKVIAASNKERQENVSNGGLDSLIASGGVTDFNRVRKQSFNVDGAASAAFNIPLTKLEDHRGNTLYDYQYMILERLYDMNGFGGGPGGSIPPGPPNGNPPSSGTNLLQRMANNRTQRVDANKIVTHNTINTERRKAGQMSDDEQAQLRNLQRFYPLLLSGELPENTNLSEEDKFLFEQALDLYTRESDTNALIAKMKSLEDYDQHQAKVKARYKKKTGTMHKIQADDDKKLDATYWDYLGSLGDDYDVTKDEIIQNEMTNTLAINKKLLEAKREAAINSASSWTDIWGNGTRDTSKYHQLPEGVSAEDGLLDQLMKANDLGAKMDVMRHNFDALVDSPRVMLTSVIGKAEGAIYDVLFGKNVGEVDENGRPIKGIFDKMVSDANKLINEGTSGLASGLKSFFGEVKKIFGTDENGEKGLLSFIGDFFKKETGLDVSDLGNRAKIKARKLGHGAVDSITQAMRAQGKTIKNVAAEAMHTVGLTNDKGEFDFGRKISDFLSDKKDEQETPGAAFGSHLFGGNKSWAILSKGEAVIPPQNNAYAKAAGITNYGVGTDYVKSSGLYPLAPGSRVINARENVNNPFRAQADLNMQSRHEDSIRNAMKYGAYKMADFIPGYAKGTDNKTPTEEMSTKELMAIATNGNASRENRLLAMKFLRAKGVDTSQMEESLNITNEKLFRRLQGTDLTNDQMNSILSSRSVQEADALITQILQKLEEDGVLKDKSKKSKIKQALRALADFAFYSPQSKEKVKVLLSGLEKDNQGNIQIAKGYNQKMVDAATDEKRLNKMSYRDIDVLRSVLEGLGLKDQIGSNEQIAQNKFSQKQGPLTGIRQFWTAMFGSDPKEGVEKTVDYTKENLGTWAKGGAVGALMSAVLPLGGPFMGALVGAAANTLNKSKSFNDYVFGTEISRDEKTGKVKRENDGLISQKTQAIMNKYLPDMKKYAKVGAIAGLITPFGPLGGAMIGAASSIIKNNAAINRALFGDTDGKGGLLGKNAKQKIKKALPHMGAAMLGTFFLGPFGLLGNAVLGAGIGFVSTTEMFKKTILGAKGRDGKRRGGLAGVIRRQIVEPLKSTMQDFKDNFGSWFKEKIFNPVAEGLKPIGKVAIGMTEKGLKAAFKKLRDTFEGNNSWFAKFLPKSLNSLFGAAREAGGWGKLIAQKAGGWAAEKIAGRVQKLGQRVEDWGYEHGMISDDARGTAEYYKRKGIDNNFSRAVNAMAEMDEDTLKAIKDQLQLTHSVNTGDVENQIRKMQNRETEMLTGDIEKLAQEVGGPEGRAISKLGLRYQSVKDLKKLDSIKGQAALEAELFTGTRISKENKEKILKYIEGARKNVAKYQSNMDASRDPKAIKEQVQNLKKMLNYGGTDEEFLADHLEKLTQIAENESDTRSNEAYERENMKKGKEGDTPAEKLQESQDKNTEVINKQIEVTTKLTETLQNFIDAITTQYSDDKGYDPYEGLSDEEKADKKEKADLWRQASDINTNKKSRKAAKKKLAEKYGIDTSILSQILHDNRIKEKDAEKILEDFKTEWANGNIADMEPSLREKIEKQGFKKTFTNWLDEKISNIENFVDNVIDEIDPPGKAFGDKLFTAAYLGYPQSYSAGTLASGLGQVAKEAGKTMYQAGKESFKKESSSAMAGMKESVKNALLGRPVNENTTSMASSSLANIKATKAEIANALQGSISSGKAGGGDVQYNTNEDGTKTMTVSTGDGDLLTYGQSQNDKSPVLLPTKDNSEVKEKIEKKTKLQELMANALQAIAEKLGAHVEGTKEGEKKKGFLDSLMDLIKSPLAFLGGALRAGAGFVGGLLTKYIFTPLKEGVKKLGKTVFSALGKVVKAPLLFLKQFVMKNPKLAAILGITSYLGKKVYDGWFDTDEGMQDGVDGFSGTKNGLGKLNPKEQRTATELVKAGKSEEEIAAILKEQRKLGANNMDPSDIKGDGDISARQAAISWGLPIGGSILGSRLMKNRALGAGIGGALAGGVATFMNTGELPGMTDLAMDAAIGYGMNKLMPGGNNPPTPPGPSGRAAGGSPPRPPHGPGGGSGLWSKAKNVLGGAWNILKKNKKLALLGAAGYGLYNYFGGNSSASNQTPNAMYDPTMNGTQMPVNNQAMINQQQIAYLQSTGQLPPDYQPPMVPPGQTDTSSGVLDTAGNMAMSLGTMYAGQKALGWGYNKLTGTHAPIISYNGAPAAANAANNSGLWSKAKNVLGGAWNILKKNKKLALLGAAGYGLYNYFSNGSSKPEQTPNTMYDPTIQGTSVPISPNEQAIRDQQIAYLKATGQVPPDYQPPEQPDGQSSGVLGTVGSFATDMGMMYAGQKALGWGWDKLKGANSSPISSEAPKAIPKRNLSESQIKKLLTVANNPNHPMNAFAKRMLSERAGINSIITDPKTGKILTGATNMETFKNVAKFGASNIAEKAGVAYETVKTGAQSIGNKAISYAGNLAEKAGSAWTGAKEGVINAGSKLAEKAGAAYETARSGAQSIANKTVNAVKTGAEYAGKAASAIEEKALVIIDKIKSAGEAFLKAISKFVPKAVEGLKTFLSKIFTKLCDPKIIKSVAVKVVKKGVLAVATGGIGLAVVQGAFAVKGYFDGKEKDATAELFKVKPEQVTSPMQTISGITNAFVNFIPFLDIILPLVGGEKYVRDVVIATIGPMIGFTIEDLNKLSGSKENKDETTETETSITTEKEQKEGTSTFDKIKDAAKISMKMTAIGRVASYFMSDETKKKTEEIGVVLEGKITDALNDIKSALGKFLPTNVKDGFTDLANSIISEAVRINNINKGMDVLKRLQSSNNNAKDEIPSTIMNFTVDKSQATKAYVRGTLQTNNTLNIPVEAASKEMKMISGIIQSITTAIPFLTGFVDEKTLVGLVLDKIGAYVGLSKADIEKAKATYLKAQKSESKISNNLAQANQERSQGKNQSATNNKLNANKVTSTDPSKQNPNQTANNTATDSDTAPKSMWQTVKDTASSTWEGVKSTASNVWSKAKELGSRAWNAVFGSGKGLGRASSDPWSQLNPAYSGIGFNTSHDTQRQYARDSWCGPLAASFGMHKLGLGGDNPFEAANYVLSHNGKEKDGGTYPSALQNYARSKGADTFKVTNQKQAQDLINDGGVLLTMGKESSVDKTGEGRTTPYGKNPHWLTVSKDGVHDSESSGRNRSYNVKDILNHSTEMIGMRRGKNNTTKITGKRFGRSKYGRGNSLDGVTEQEVLKRMMYIAAALAKKCGSNHPELFFAQMIHETGGPANYIRANKAAGIGDDHNYGGFTWYPEMGAKYKGASRPSAEGGFYAKFDNDDEYIERAYNDVYKRYASKLAQANTPEEFARILKFEGYYAAPESEYVAGLKSALNTYSTDLKNIGNINVSTTSVGSSSSSNSSTSKVGGFFGALAQIANEFSSIFGGTSTSSTSSSNGAPGSGTRTTGGITGDGNTMHIDAQTGGNCTIEATRSMVKAYTDRDEPKRNEQFSWWNPTLEGDLKGKWNYFGNTPEEKAKFEAFISNHFNKKPGNPLFLYQTGGDGRSGNHPINKGQGDHATVIGRKLSNGKYEHYDSAGGVVKEFNLGDIFDPSARGGKQGMAPGQGNSIVEPQMDPSRPIANWQGSTPTAQQGQGKFSKTGLGKLLSNYGKGIIGKSIKFIGKTVFGNQAFDEASAAFAEEHPNIAKAIELAGYADATAPITVALDEADRMEKAIAEGRMTHEEAYRRMMIINGYYGQGSKNKSRFGRSKYGMEKSTPNTNQAMWDYLKSKGLSNVSAAGIMGNFKAESSMYSDIIEGGAHSDTCPRNPAVVDDVDPPGYGLPQFTWSSLKDAYINYANSKGQPHSDWKTQIDFLFNDSKSGVTPAIISKMDQTQDPHKAALVWHSDFEKSNDSPQAAARRGTYAKEFFDTQGQGIIDGSSNIASGGSSGGNSGGMFGFLGGMMSKITAPIKAGWSKLTGALSKAFANNPAIKKISELMFGGNPFASLLGIGGSNSNSSGGATSVYNGPINATEAGKKIVAEARTHIGKPYVMGANGPNAYDCSSHAQTSYAAAGLDIPRQADYQYEFFKEKNAVVSIEQAQPGDLIFFSNTYQDGTPSPNDITHVGVVTKPGNANTLVMCHAGKPVAEIVLRDWDRQHLPSDKPPIGSLALAFPSTTEKPKAQLAQKFTEEEKEKNTKVVEDTGLSYTNISSGISTANSSYQPENPDDAGLYDNIDTENPQLGNGKRSRFGRGKEESYLDNLHAANNLESVPKPRREKWDTSGKFGISDKERQMANFGMGNSNDPASVDYWLAKGYSMDDAMEKAWKSTKRGYINNKEVNKAQEKAADQFNNNKTNKKPNPVTLPDSKKEKDTRFTAPNGLRITDNDINYLKKNGYTEDQALETLKKDKKYTEPVKKKENTRYKAPNGLRYSKNDIDYLVKNGYTEDQAINLLKKEKKYTDPVTEAEIKKSWSQANTSLEASKIGNPTKANKPSGDPTDIKTWLSQGYSMEDAMEKAWESKNNKTIDGKALKSKDTTKSNKSNTTQTKKTNNKALDLKNTNNTKKQVQKVANTSDQRNTQYAEQLKTEQAAKQKETNSPVQQKNPIAQVSGVIPQSSTKTNGSQIGTEILAAQNQTNQLLAQILAAIQGALTSVANNNKPQINTNTKEVTNPVMGTAKALLSAMGGGSNLGIGDKFLPKGTRRGNDQGDIMSILESMNAIVNR